MEADRLSQSTAPVSATAHLRSAVSVVMALLAGGLLRAWMLKKFFEVSGDSRLYGGMAKNLLLRGQYAITDNSGVVHPTLIRLPGYPLFLAACFRLFGVDHYAPAAWIQIALDLAGCVLLAAFVFRIASPSFRLRAAHSTLWLAALCPFTAVYAAEPLTEALTVFCITLALWSAARFRDRPDWPSALAFTFAVTFAALLRPDGALVGVALAPALAASLIKTGRPAQQPSNPDKSPDPANNAGLRPSTRGSNPRGALAADGRRPFASMVLICVLIALAPFAAWTWRNWRVFHVIQPLAPRYATDPGEDVYPGWQRWVKTWALDFVSTYEVYWNVPGSPLELKALPGRAFDSPAQYAETAQIAADYEANGEDLSPGLDDRFAQLAAERICAHALRYYVWLPLGRVADMWLRPRVENLPIDLDWWVYKHHYAETRFSWAYAALNTLYLLLGFAGLCLRPRMWPWMLAYMVLRSALLATIEAPEARYTVECFPMIFALGGIALGRVFRPASHGKRNAL